MYELSDRVWVPLTHPKIEEIKVRLTRIPDSMTKASEPLCGYKIIGDFIGIPRNFAFRNAEWIGSTYIDRTTKPYKVWPDFIGRFRYGQKEAVACSLEKLQKNQHGLLLQGKCGSGKTLVSLVIASQLQTRVLVTVHKKDLYKQWMKTAEEHFPGIKTGFLQGRNLVYDEDCHLVIGMVQSLYRHQKKFSKDFWAGFGLHIFDEGHRYPAKTFEPILGISPCKYRLAVSATWRRRDKMEIVWGWHVASEKCIIKTESLTGTYKQVRWNTRYTDKNFSRFGKINHALMLNMIAEDVPYNNWVLETLKKSLSAKRKILVLSDRKSQIYFLLEKLIELGYNDDVGLYIGGQEKIAENTKHRPIILATYAMFSEGTDIPDLDTLLFATPRTDIEQAVGRIQRPSEDKKPLVVVDPVWQTSYNQLLGRKRIEYFKKLGFKSADECETSTTSASK